MPRTLLLADDSVTIQRVVELAFAHEDVRVVALNDGPRTLQWLETGAPDIMLVDIGIPDSDGYTVAAAVKRSERLAHVPVILLAGAFEPVDEPRARSIGCDGVIVKPFEPKHLVERVKELLQVPVAATVPTGAAPAGEGPPPVPARRVVEPQPLELPARPMWDPGPARAQAPQVPQAPQEASGAQAKVALVNVFSALLAAEKAGVHAVPPAPLVPAPPAAISEAAIEAAVRRVLEQMTADAVQRIVYEVAERLVKEEIERIKALPD